VWQFGKGPNDFSQHSIIGTNDAQRVGPFTLMAGTGDPAGSPPAGDLCPNPNGCPDNRVILVDPFGRIVWQYGQFGVTGSGPDQLNTPVQATWLPNGHVLITDQANERIIEVTLGKRIVWQYGMTGVSGNGPDQLNNPNSAELLANGHILIADENNNRAIEVTHDDAKKIVATFTVGGTASGVAFASRLPNGDTLLTDSNNFRIVEVNSQDQPVWQYSTFVPPPAGNPNPLPTRAVRLRDGETLISDQFNDRVIEVVRTGSMGGTIERQLGTLNMPGIGGGLLDAPYDAKVIGDYTGLTPPFGFED
jgi:outer membrane protein assembly factor BamB